MSAGLSALPVLNRDTFKQTAAYLAPDVVATYMRTIAERCDALLHDLHQTPNPGAAIGEAAHALAGSAGLFGFERVAAAGRHFEKAVLNNAPNAPDLAEHLRAALEATLQNIGAQAFAAAV